MKSEIKAEYAEALKQIYSKSLKENLLLIEFDYAKSILLPYDEGLKFIGCLKQAELYTASYSKPKTIQPFNSDHFKTSILSRKDYEDIKIAHLLGLTVEELNAPESKEPETIP